MTQKRKDILKLNQKVVKDYYQDLEEYSKQNVKHEGAVRSAFQNLLSTVAKKNSWILIPELSDSSGNRTTRPDGTVRDKNSFVRGHWEAKDIDDDIDDAIKSKKKAGYPLSNIIFENTKTAVLYQNKHEVLRVDLTAKQQLVDLINSFFAFEEPTIEEFNKAVAEFKDRVKGLAEGLNEKIKEAHKVNDSFKSVFANLFDLCKTSLNPNISRDAIDEMLIQHLLTERLITEIFKNSEFIKRNVIAIEIENVIDALTSTYFSRHEYLKELDRFYLAIENAARSVSDFNDRLRVLNTVYEQFFQGYSVKVADTHGIVYTPPEIVDFMCNSVIEALDLETLKIIQNLPEDCW